MDDTDIFAQFDPQPMAGPKPPPEPRPNGRRKMKAGGKRGRPRKASVVADSRPVPESDIVRVRAPRRSRAPRIEVTEEVTRMFLRLSPRQRERVMATLTRLFT